MAWRLKGNSRVERQQDEGSAGQKLKKTKEVLGVYKDILDQMARADQEIAEAEMLELEAAAAADQHLVDQAGDESR